MATMDYDSFVFYGNWRTILDGFDKETAKDILWQIMLYGTAGEVDTSNPMINGIVMGCCAVGIDKAKDRYANAVDNGKKGGRPTEVDAAANYSEAQIGLALKMAIAEVEDYTHRELDYSLQLIAERIAIIKLNRMGTEGLNSMSVSGLSENYINGYPADIIATLNAKRKIRVM